MSERGEQICLSVTDDDDDDDIGHWVKEIERLLCEAGSGGAKWRGRLKGTVERAIDLDRLIADWTADKGRKEGGGRARFRPTHHYKRQEEETAERERTTLALPERDM